MKNLFIILSILGISTLIVSCEKEDISQKIDITNNTLETDNSNYTFSIDTEWVIQEKNYVFENGNIFDLYINLNNELESKFIIKKESKLDGAVYDGTYTKVYENGVLVSRMCGGVANDCRAIISTRGDEVISVRIILKG